MIDPFPVDPIEGLLNATVTLPGSKSITNRALVCAALAKGRSVLRGALVADDTLAMVGALRSLGCEIGVDGTTVTVDGVDGRFPAVGVTVDAALSGTTARFILAVAHLASGPVTIDGGAPLRLRPMADGVDALRRSGGQLESTTGRLPVTVQPGGSATTEAEVGGDVSSQFLSGLLMASPAAGVDRTIRVAGALRSPDYVSMTVAVMEHFGARVDSAGDGTEHVVAATGYTATDLDIEPDASAASYAFGAAALVGGRVTVDGLGSGSIQGDVRFVNVLESMGAIVDRSRQATTVTGTGSLRGVDVDMGDISDTAQTLACLAPFADGPTRIEGIGFIRGKETDRIAAVVTELRRLGVEAEELADGIAVGPGRPGRGVVRTYDDHRMAMSFALMGLVVKGIVDRRSRLRLEDLPRLLVNAGRTERECIVSVIAIDGPAGSGKSTVARALAERLALEVLDTGAMYRAVTAAVLRRGIDVDDRSAIAGIVDHLDIETAGGVTTLDGDDVSTYIRSGEVSAAVSTVAAHSEVRARLRDMQRQWMVRHGGGVVEGRDIGTVVFPDADLKVFLDASPSVRAARRAAEGVMDGTDAAANIAERDRVDSTRRGLSTGRGRGLLRHRHLRRHRRPDRRGHRGAPAMNDAPQSRLGYEILGAVVRGAGKTIWRVEVVGSERIPIAGGAVLAPIHRSNLDFLLAAFPTRRRVRFMAKHTVFTGGVSERVVRSLGAFPVKRGTPDRAAFEFCERLLAQGELVVIFPEGTRCSGPEVHPLFDGPAFMAARQRVPIVPIGIGGSERAMPRGAKMIRPAKIVVTVGEPIYPDVPLEGAVTRQQVSALTDRLARAVQAQFDDARSRAGG